MPKQGKVWGETQLIFRNEAAEFHRIEATAGSYCSKHKHEHKYNKFFCEHGVMDIEVWQNDYALVDVTTIQAGESTTVPPGCFHRFKAVTDCVVYEIYWVSLEGKDIVRDDVGGTP